MLRRRDVEVLLAPLSVLTWYVDSTWGGAVLCFMRVGLVVRDGLFLGPQVGPSGSQAAPGL